MILDSTYKDVRMRHSLKSAAVFRDSVMNELAVIDQNLKEVA